MKTSEQEKEACAVEGCNTPKRARGWCAKHWKRWKAHGDPTYTKISEPIRGGTNEERFWPKVEVTGFCWNWTGSTTGDEKDGKGHGYFNLGASENRRGIVAHKFAYETLVGPVSEGLELDHLCRNTRCVNPDHLEPVTHEENLRRGFAPAQRVGRTKICSYGHDISNPVNLYQAGGGRMICAPCTRRRQSEYNARKGRSR